MTEWEKLRPVGCNIFRGIPDGYEMKNGKTRRKYRYADFKKTAGYGELEVDTWLKRCQKELETEGLTDLYRAIMEHLGPDFLRNKKSKQEYAIDCIYIEAWKYWPDFRHPQEPETIIWL